MNDIGQRELFTQQHVVQFFQTDLKYKYLGHWKDRWPRQESAP